MLLYRIYIGINIFTVVVKYDKVYTLNELYSNFLSVAQTTKILLYVNFSHEKNYNTTQMQHTVLVLNKIFIFYDNRENILFVQREMRPLCFKNEFDSSVKLKLGDISINAFH